MMIDVKLEKLTQEGGSGGKFIRGGHEEFGFFEEGCVAHWDEVHFDLCRHHEYIHIVLELHCGVLLLLLELLVRMNREVSGAMFKRETAG